MIGTFRFGYRMAFDTKILEHLPFLICIGMHCLTLHLMLMISASVVNEKSKELARCLLHRIPGCDKVLKSEFKKDLKEENYLTVWKIYTFDRSLILASFGTLFTYGILIGTLGKDN
ncbi:hypothetical protein AVEN_217466-1 [Araneus ventricosus]|uniref:Gustatory receptor n=1 Tax=Araneus ventricosus TaxID=182803 RepID=A0A4Y2UNI5_ARAVE|nr:hypothetical protein AVEN_217466-1 [Araneus ventricosus]